MKKFEVKDIDKFDIPGIDKKVSEMREAIFEIRMQKAAAGIEKPHQLKIAKKNIARLLTVKKSRG